MTEPLAKHCPFCEKQGLPILPLRYAVARTDLENVRASWKALDLPRTFGDDVTDIELPTDSAKYTARLLRPGYLYVLDEAREHWSAYLVTQQGFLYQFDIEDITPPDADTVEFTCFRTGEEYIARCITIPDAANAEDVWLGFSDTAWTPAVLEKHRSARYRKKHMRKIKVDDGYDGKKHTADLTRLSEVVNEFDKAGDDPADDKAVQLGYTLNTETGERTALIELRGTTVTCYPAFDFSPYRFAGLKHEAPGLVDWANRAAGTLKPMLVALDDPAGIAAELNELVKARAVEWAEEPERKRKHESALLIGAVKQAVEHGAELQESELRKNIVGVLGALFPAHVGAATGGQPGISGVVAGMERAGRINESELAGIHARAWDKYEDMYDEPSRLRFLNEEYPRQLKAFEDTTLAPLDAGYLAWLKSKSFRRHFICNYDRDDCESGMGYVGVLYQLLLDAAGRKTVCDYLDDCLRADPVVDDPMDTTAEQILLRGLVLNQDVLAKQWNEVAQAPYEPKDGWEGMAGALYGAFRSKLSGAMTAAVDALLQNLARYSYEFGGAFIRRMQAFYEPATGRVVATIAEHRVMALMGVLVRNGAPHLRMVAVHTEANRQQSSRLMAMAAEAMSGDRAMRLRRGVRLQDLFDPLASERMSFRGILLLDETEVGRFSGRLSPDLFASRMQRHLQRLSGGLLDAGTHFVGALLATLTLGSAWTDMRKKPGLKSTMGFASGLATVAGGTLEGAEMALRGTGWGSTQLARQLTFGTQRISSRAMALGFVGRVIGAAASVVGGVLAIWEGIETYDVNRAYGVTMILLGAGMVAAGLLMLIASASPVGFVLALLLAMIMLVVGFLKPDDIEKWLDKAIGFGRGGQGAFDSIEEQLEAMKMIGNDNATQAG